MRIAFRYSVIPMLVLLGVRSALMAQTAEPADNRESLTRQMLSAYRAQNYDKAIEVGLKLARLDAHDANTQYNLACVYALKGDKPAALEWLAKSADSGFSNLKLVKEDTDLASIRGEAAYAKALELVEKTSARYRQKAGESKPLVVVPVGLDESKPAPLIVALHGVTGTAESIAEQWKDAAKEAGAILVAPRAVRPFAPGFEWGDDVDEVELIVMNALKQAKAEHKIDEARIVLTGFSQGGAMAFNLGLRRAKDFCGVIPVAGEYNPSNAVVPEGDDKLPRFYLMVGSRDSAVGSNRKAAEELENAKATVKLKVFADLGHEFPKDRTPELRSALKYVFGG